MAFTDSEAFNIISEHVRPRYHDDQAETWERLPEIPDSSEIMPPETPSDSKLEPWNEYQKDPVYDQYLPHNTVKGPWENKSKYVSAHYQILREDAIAGLRQSVRSFKASPEMKDSDDTWIYTSVYFRGLQLAGIGAAFRIQFSTRCEKQIRWAQSKRLLQGTMVALSPETDAFRTICKIAIVAARPFENGVELNPPEIDIFWGKPEDAICDPVEPYILLEARSSYFEASRHMLVALQKLEAERFPFSNYLVHLDSDIQPPEYLIQNPFLDLRTLARQDSKIEVLEGLQNVDVLKHFPNIPDSGMDTSQISACRRMLSDSFAIIQGPPGTGKTYTSLAALRVMLENLGVGDAPIIIAAKTNHAVDQMLNHIMEFDPNILRLGGRSDKKNEEIIKRTLYELRRNTENVPRKIWANLTAAYAQLKIRVEEVRSAIGPILRDEILRADSLLKHKIISQKQFDSLEMNDGWEADDTKSPIENWVEDQLVPITGAPPTNNGLPMEEDDLEFEKLQDLTGEAGDAISDDKGDVLRGDLLPFTRRFSSRSPQSPNLRKMKQYLSRHQDLYAIPIGKRGEVYRYWEILENKRMTRNLRMILKDYQNSVEQIRIAKWLSNVRFVRHLGIKLIGCTTTGLHKYRGFLAALKPRTMLIEEAAEAVEGSIMAGMFESLEQLILVGDHKQLQSHCNVQALEHAPYHLNISMFERLVNNAIQFTMLNEQRRMIPDIRQLLCIEPAPFYRSLKDHASVLKRPPVPGMGFNTYFFHHDWPEGRNADSSRYNIDEAEMVTKFFWYLTMNGVKQEKITILTFYNGQRKTILRLLKGTSSSTVFNVFTIDSYQGMENDVVLLSLVRSNSWSKIGFLENKNRIVVALSRARNGLYIFGNAVTMVSAETLERDEILGHESLWNPLVKHLTSKGCFDLDGGLPIMCKNHGTTLRLYEPDDWIQNHGGCDKNCGDFLPCGHKCPYNCHPFPHAEIVCDSPCSITLSCGHGCSAACGQTCDCSMCDVVFNATLMSSGEDENPRTRRTAFACGKRGENSSVSQKKAKDASLDVRSEVKAKSSPNKNERNFNATEGSSQGDWKYWNATKADNDVKEKAHKTDIQHPKIEPQSLVFKDVHRRVVVKNGERLVAKGVERVVPRLDPILLKPMIKEVAYEKLLNTSNFLPALIDFEEVDSLVAPNLESAAEAATDSEKMSQLLGTPKLGAISLVCAEERTKVACFRCHALKPLERDPYAFDDCPRCYNIFCDQCRCACDEPKSVVAGALDLSENSAHELKHLIAAKCTSLLDHSLDCLLIDLSFDVHHDNLSIESGKMMQQFAGIETPSRQIEEVEKSSEDKQEVDSEILGDLMTFD